eukprot:gene27213-2461_t
MEDSLDLLVASLSQALPDPWAVIPPELLIRNLGGLDSGGVPQRFRRRNIVPVKIVRTQKHGNQKPVNIKQDTLDELKHDPLEVKLEVTLEGNVEVKLEDKLVLYQSRAYYDLWHEKAPEAYKKQKHNKRHDFQNIIKSLGGDSSARYEALRRLSDHDPGMIKKGIIKNRIGMLEDIRKDEVLGEEGCRRLMLQGKDNGALGIHTLAWYAKKDGSLDELLEFLLSASSLDVLTHQTAHNFPPIHVAARTGYSKAASLIAKRILELMPAPESSEEITHPAFFSLAEQHIH